MSTRAVLLTVLIVIFVFVSICTKECPLAASLVFLKLANILVTILPGANAFSMALVVFPFALIMMTFEHQMDTLAMEFTRFPVSLIEAHARSHKHAYAVWISIFINLAFIETT